MDADQHVISDSQLTSIVIGAFYNVYNQLGYGFLESVYRRALAHELQKQNLRVECEHGIDVLYGDVIVGQFRADLLVDRRLIVKTKASQALVDADWKQLLNYLKATHIELGLLLHFGPRAFFQALRIRQCKERAMCHDVLDKCTNRISENCSSNLRTSAVPLFWTRA